MLRKSLNIFFFPRMFHDKRQKRNGTPDVNPRNIFVIPSLVKRAFTCSLLNIDMNIV